MSVIMTPEKLNARKRRSLWIALVVGAFIVLVFLITLAKLQAGVLDRPL
ncbi:MAG: hypothetical protein ACT4OF_10980 [Caulobacteraceae bacterium]